MLILASLAKILVFHGRRRRTTMDSAGLCWDAKFGQGFYGNYLMASSVAFLAKRKECACVILTVVIDSEAHVGPVSSDPALYGHFHGGLF